MLTFGCWDETSDVIIVLVVDVVLVTDVPLDEPVQ